MDAGFYQQEFLELESQMRASPYGACLLGNDLSRVFKGAFYVLAEDYQEKGVPFLRVTEITGGYVDLAKCVYLDRKVHQREKKTAVRTGNLVIAKGGSIGNAAIIPQSIHEANISQDLIGAVAKPNLDPYFAYAFLTSRFGVRQMIRWSQGNVHPYITNDAVRNIYSPIAPGHLQSAIGNYQRKAERLRELADKLGRDIDELFTSSLSWKSSILKSSGHGAWVHLNELKQRLDGQYNSPLRLAVTRHFSRCGTSSATLSELAEISAMIGWKGLTTEHYTDVGPYLIRGVDFENGILEFSNLVRVDQRKYDEQPQIHLLPGDVVVTKDGTIGKALAIPQVNHPMCAGSTIARLRPTSDIRPEFLEAVLNHECVQSQIESFATGLAQPHITQEWIAELLIPRLECEDEIADRIAQHHQYLYSARDLIDKSKNAVESLIGGTLDEPTLHKESAQVESWLEANPSPYAPK